MLPIELSIGQLADAKGLVVWQMYNFLRSSLFLEPHNYTTFMELLLQTFEMQVPLDNLSESGEIVLNKGVCNILEVYHLVEQLDNDNSSWRIALQATLFQNILDANNWVKLQMSIT